MRRILSLVALSVSLVGGVAAADPHREVVHENVNVHVRGPVVRENVHENINVRGPMGHGPVVHENVVVHDNIGVRENVNVGVRDNLVIREPGREGVVVRGGPMWHEGVHFRDYHVRPEYRAENFAPIAGYGWHRGDWVWNGSEWFWQPGWYVRVNL